MSDKNKTKKKALAQEYEIEGQKLFRVDLSLKYLVLTDKKEYNQYDVLKWLREECHEGEFDEDDSDSPNECIIQEVDDSEMIQDFLDMDIDYNVYGTDGISISTVVEAFDLDTPKLIKELQKRGYKVSK